MIGNIGPRIAATLRFAACVSVIALAAAHSPTALASDAYPSKPIRLVVPVAPGGTNDTVSRLIANGLSTHLNVPVVVENRPGAAGVVALTNVVKMEPDGYTLLMAGGNVLSILPVLNKNLPYKLEEITPVSLISQHPIYLYTSTASGFTSVDKLVRDAKAKPDTISFATHGVGSTAHLCAELFSQLAGIRMVHVPYKGGSQPVPDLVSGRTQVFFETDIVMPMARSEEVNVIAVNRKERVPSQPSIPTFAEAGYPDFSLSLWFALVGPRGIPQPVLDRINEAVRKTVTDPAFRAKYGNDGTDFTPRSGAELDEFIKAQSRNIERLAATRGITLTD